jgi:type II secretory pathway component PulM
VKATLLNLWRAREPAEQRTLALGAAALAVLLVIALAILPLLEQHRALAARLPELRRQAELLALEADQVVALRSQSRSATDAAPPRGAFTSVDASARAAGLRAQMETFAAQPDGRVEIAMASVAFDVFIDWTRQLRRTTGYDLDALESDSLDEPGLVRVKAVLAPVAVSTAASRP